MVPFAKGLCHRNTVGGEMSLIMADKDRVTYGGGGLPLGKGSLVLPEKRSSAAYCSARHQDDTVFIREGGDLRRYFFNDRLNDHPLVIGNNGCTQFND